MKRTSLILGISVLAGLTLAFSIPAQPPGTQSESAKGAETKQSGSAPIDLSALIREWEKHRDEARDRWLANQKVYQGGPGFLGPAINRDRGLQEAAEWMISDLKKLQQSAKTEDAKRAGLSDLRAGWLKGREGAHQRWEQNRRMLPGSPPTEDAAQAFWDAILNTKRGPATPPPGGRLIATINNEAGMMEAFDWMFSDLEKYLGKLPPPPTTKSPAQAVIDRLPNGIITKEQLDEFLDENRDLGLSAEVLREVKDLFVKSRAERIARLQALARTIRGTPVPLSSSPGSPVLFDPSAKDAAVVVAADEDGVRATLDSMSELVRRLTGSSPNVKLWYVWKVSTAKQADSGPTYEPRVVVPVQEPKPIKVSVLRHARFDVDVADEDSLEISLLSLVGNVHSAEGDLEIQFKPLEFPTDIAGLWKGSLVVQTLPILEQWKPDVGEPSSASDDPLQSLGEGCSIPPEAFAQIRQQLENLKGKALEMTIDLEPASVFAGQATVRVTPPRGSLGTTEPATYPYQFANGVLAIEGARDKMVLAMKGTFSATAAGWKVSGSWQATGQVDGKKVVVMTGTWSASNPNAK